jgi:rare lipoprotein A (peptidoglycan hydrolase)
MVGRLFLLAFLVVGCSTAAHEPTPRATPDTAGVGSAPETVDTLSGDIAFAMIGGKATWYCGNGSPCTSGYGPADLVAAIDPSTGIGKGARLIVHHGNRHVTVQVVDVCACGGSRVIDLTSGAFSRLAPLSRGVIDVAIEVVDRTPVAAGRMTLPPTSTETKP